MDSNMVRRPVLFALALLFAVPAAAQTRNPALNKMGKIVRAKFQPFQEDVRLEGRNKVREDLVFQTRANFDQTFQEYKDAYQFHTVMKGGVRVLGYFIVPNKRVATFTLSHGGEKWMLVMRENPDGAELVLWGHSFARKGKRKVRRRPFHRGHPKSPTVRYGL